MVNLFDIMRAAQSGAAIGNLSRQFGLSTDQTHRALEAMLPAFTLGFQRSSRDPNAFAALLGTTMSGRYAPFFDGGAGAAFGAAQAAGEGVMRQIFGSGDADRKIAAEAAGPAGVAAGIIQAMLPVVAATLVGGLFRFATVEGMADLLRGMSDWLRAVGVATGARAPEPPASPFAAWAKMMTAATPGGAGGRAKPAPADPWADLFAAAVTGAAATSSALAGVALSGMAPSPPPPPPPPAPEPSPNALEPFLQMFETGRDAQAQQLAAMARVLDELWGARGLS